MGSGKREDHLDEDMSPEDEAIGLVVPGGFRLQELRPAALECFFSGTWRVSATNHGVVWWHDHS